MSVTKTVRPGADVTARLNKSADATRRSKSFAAAEAIREIEAALREANACDFASNAEVLALANKWRLDASY